MSIPKGFMDLLKDSPDDVLKRIVYDTDHAREYRSHYVEQWFRFYRKYRGKHDPDFLKYRHGKFTIFVPLLFSLIENIIPRFVLGTFGGYPIINVVPVSEDDIEPAKKAENLINTQLHRDKVLLKSVGWFKQFSMFGTSPAKVVWKKDVARLKSKEVVRYMGPSLIPLDAYDLLVDPKATDEGISSSGYLVHSIILGEEEMKERVMNAAKYNYKFSGIDIMSETTSLSPSNLDDKFSRERELGISTREGGHRRYWLFDEYWTPSALVTVLNRRHIIRRVENGLLDYPFINLNRNPLLGEFYGIGDIEAVEDLMDEINYIRNLRLDNLDMLINLMWLIERGADVDTRELIAKAGGAIFTNDIQGIKQIDFKDMTNPSRLEEGLLKQEMQEASGMMDMLKGMTPSGMNETAAGMAMLIEGASYRIKLGLMLIEHYGIREIGDKYLRLNYLNMPEDYIVRQVGDGKWLKLKSADEIFGSYDFIPSGSSEFLNKEALRQSVMQLYNLLARDPGTDQEGLKRLVAMAFGGRLIETVLFPKGLPDRTSNGGAESVDESDMINKENEQMLQGQEIPPVGNHEQHLQGHKAIMTTPEFSQLNSGIQGIFGRHIQGHMRAMGQGAPLESPDRVAQEVGKGQEESMKVALQKPTAG